MDLDAESTDAADTEVELIDADADIVVADPDEVSESESDAKATTKPKEQEQIHAQGQGGQGSSGSRPPPKDNVAAWAHITAQMVKRPATDQPTRQPSVKFFKPAAVSPAGPSRTVSKSKHIAFFCLGCLQNGMEPKKCSIFRNDASSRNRHISRRHKDQSFCKFFPEDHAEVLPFLHSRNDSSGAAEMPASGAAGVSASETSPVMPLPLVVQTSSPGSPSLSATSRAMPSPATSSLASIALSNPPSPNVSASAQTVGSELSTPNYPDRLVALVEQLSQQQANQTRLLACLVEQGQPQAGSAARARATANLSGVSDSTSSSSTAVQAKTMGELLDHEHLDSAPSDNDTIVYCKPCMHLRVEERKRRGLLPVRHTVADAHRALNPGSVGTLSTGLLIREDRMATLLAGGPEFCRFRYTVSQHLDGHPQHHQAVVECRLRDEREWHGTNVVRSLMRCAITMIETASGSCHFETLVCLLSACKCDVGQICHGSDFGCELWKLFEACLDVMTVEFLQASLPSTGRPPNFCVTCDKSTPGRVTNQAVLLLCRSNSGAAISVPAGAPEVYDAEMDGSGPILAKRLFDSLASFRAPLDRLVAVVADGQYQSGPFMTAVADMLSKAGGNASIPMIWDVAHFLNLAVNDVRNGSGEEARTLKRFVRRANLFAHHFGHGRGFSALQAVTEGTARSVSSFAMQRFLSSATSQWKAIEEAYAELHAAFVSEGFDCSNNAPLQYELFGSDFAFDLLCLLDLVEPICALMSLAQDTQLPHWKVATMWRRVADFLHDRSQVFRKEDYPRYARVADNIHPDGSYRGVPLLEGWLLEIRTDAAHAAGAGDSAGPGSAKGNANPEVGGNRRRQRRPDQSVIWRVRDQQDLEAEMLALAAALHRTLLDRMGRCLDRSLEDCASMDVATAVATLASPTSLVDVERLCRSPAAERLVQQACKFPHLQDLEPILSRKYVADFVDTIKHVLCSGEGRDGWLEPHVEGPIRCLRILPPRHAADFKTRLTVTKDDDSVVEVALDEEAVLKSFYADTSVYCRAGQSACALLDFALNRGGTEAIVESFYGTMRSQQKYGGQANEVLQRRTKLKWMLPPLGSDACERFLDEAVKLYFRGDVKRGIRKHRVPYFVSNRATNYIISKVVDRRKNLTSHSDFVGAERDH